MTATARAAPPLALPQTRDPIEFGKVMGKPFNFRTVTDPVARFWHYVNKSGPVHPVLGTRCWVYRTARPDDYGRVLTGSGRVKAHRFSWTLLRGPVPPGLWVLHRCDNRPCVNPDHLFIGTGADNVADMINKGRHNARHGEGHPMAKLTRGEVDQIRKTYRRGSRTYGSPALARRFGVSQPMILHIVKGIAWSKSPC